MKYQNAVFVIALVSLMLTGCDESYDSQVNKFESWVAKNKMGKASDNWLEKLNAFNQWERVGLIFGYLDDYAACTDAAELLSQKYSATKYRCVPAN